MGKRLLRALRIGLCVILLLTAIIVPVVTTVGITIIRASAPPVVQSDNATYVATESFRLNATLISDGSANDTEIRFQWYADAWGVDWTDNATAWSGNFTSGQKAFADIVGQSPNTLYNFRAQAQNDGGVNSHNGTSSQFTTLTTVGVPTNLKADPLDVSIAYTWTKGPGSANTTLFMSTYIYPETVADGVLIYNGTGNTYTLPLLTPGQTYYVTGWGLSGTTYSSANVTVMATTLAMPPDLPGLPTLEEPAMWFQTANVTQFQYLPIYTTMNNNAASLSIPLATWWTLVTLFWITFLTLGTTILFKDKMTTYMVGMALVILAAVVGMISFWVGALFTIFSIGLIVWETR